MKSAKGINPSEICDPKDISICCTPCAQLASWALRKVMVKSKVPNIFSKKRRDAIHARAIHSTGRESPAHWLLEDIAHDVIERLDFMRFEPKSALIIGLGAKAVETKLSETGCRAEARTNVDEELPLSGAPFDFIASLNRLGTVNDLPGAMIHMRNALANGGLAIASFVGAGSLPTLRRIMLAADGDRPAARIHPQIDNRAGSALLGRAGFSRHVVDTVSLKVSYTEFTRFIADLREQALTNVLADPPPSIGKAGLLRAREEFDRLRDREDRVTETFEILTLTGWA